MESTAAPPPTPDAGRFQQSIWAPAGGLVRVLDAIDRVLKGHISPFAKQIIGYVALGTLAIACILLGWSFLKP